MKIHFIDHEKYDGYVEVANLSWEEKLDLADEVESLQENKASASKIALFVGKIAKKQITECKVQLKGGRSFSNWDEMSEDPKGHPALSYICGKYLGVMIGAQEKGNSKATISPPS